MRSQNQAGLNDDYDTVVYGPNKTANEREKNTSFLLNDDDDIDHQIKARLKSYHNGQSKHPLAQSVNAQQSLRPNLVRQTIDLNEFASVPKTSKTKKTSKKPHSKKGVTTGTKLNGPFTGGYEHELDRPIPIKKSVQM